MNNSHKIVFNMTEQELLSQNYRYDRNNYILKASTPNHWVAFSKSIIERLIKRYGDSFNIIVYWNKNGYDVSYYRVPFSVVKHLFTEEHLTQEASGERRRWTFIIERDWLCVHASTLYSVDISRYLHC